MRPDAAGIEDSTAPVCLRLPWQSVSRDRFEKIVARYLKGTEVKGAEFRDMLSLCWLALSGWYGTK